MKTESIEIAAKDGHVLKMYMAMPDNKPKGAILVLQEIFGVNAHIRSVCERFAAEGYVAGAPALFDRISPDYEAGYQPADIDAGRALMGKFDFGACILDMTVAVEKLKAHGDVFVAGFCLGGSLAYKVAVLNNDIAAASCYYGGRIADFADDTPLCPTILHYGETDQSIPMDNVETVRAKQPDLPLYLYPAGHGFSCDARGSYEPVSAKLAWQRTMDLFNSLTT